MLPTIEERLDSIIRALSTIVMASLPPEAKLAREQVQLCIGHLDILRDQIAFLPQFEQEEKEDAIELATSLLSIADGGAATLKARAELASALSNSEGMRTASTSREINSAIGDLVEAVFLDGRVDSRSNLMKSIPQFERKRSNKDRALFSEYGFDAAQLQ